MFGKFLLIALVCVSVSQVHGGVMENAISSNLRKARNMNENAKARLSEAEREVYENRQLISYKTTQFIHKSDKVQEDSRQTLRNTAYAMEKKAEENSRPESVFRCIRGNEERANNEIETFTRKFATDMERLKGTKLANINTAAESYSGLSNDLEVRYIITVSDLHKCRNARCLITVMGSYSKYLNSLYATIRRVEGLMNTVLGNFQRDANNYFTNSNRQITRIRTAANSNIKNCYLRGEKLFSISNDSQEV